MQLNEVNAAQPNHKDERNKPDNNKKEKTPEKTTGKNPEIVSDKKEKSVLQAKLTKLAIQIGYVGNNYRFTSDETGKLFIYYY